MKRNILWMGMLAIALAFGMTVVGCDDDPTNDDLTVTFNLDGGNINGYTASVQISVKSGGTIDNLPNPQKANYNFSGWFTGTNGSGNAFTTTTIVTSNMTVFANWTNGNNEPEPIPEDDLDIKTVIINGLSAFNGKKLIVQVFNSTNFSATGAMVATGGIDSISSGVATVYLYVPDAQGNNTETGWNENGPFYVIINVNSTYYIYAEDVNVPLQFTFQKDFKAQIAFDKFKSAN